MSTTMMHRATIAAALAGLAGAGCFHDNANYCEDAPFHNCRNLIDAGPQACTGDPECSSPQVCDVAGTMTCVECTPAKHEACMGATPACIHDRCQPCTEHAQCGDTSNVCLPDGTCAQATEVAYVDPEGTDNMTCSQRMPCTKVSSALATGRPYVKFHGTTDEAVSISGGRVVTFLADPGARLTRGTGNGAIVTVQDNGTSLSVYDLAISDAPNQPGGIGCVIPTAGGTPALSLTRAKLTNNPGGGISAGGGMLTVSQSTVSGNAGGGISASGGTVAISRSTISGNAGGGISVTGTGTAFDLENNFILFNGTATEPGATQNGGVVITSNTTGSKLERNTIAYNASSGLSFRGGLSCNAPLVSARLNLLFHNTESDATGGTKNDATTQKNDAGSCQYGNTLAVSTDAGNLGFKSPTRAPFDFHLTSASPPMVVDAGGACAGVDVDGQPRPGGAACDLGADEYHP